MSQVAKLSNLIDLTIGDTELCLKHGWEIRLTHGSAITNPNFFSDNGFTSRIILSTIKKVSNQTVFIKQDKSFFHIFAYKYHAIKLEDFTYYRLKKSELLCTFNTEDEYNTYETNRRNLMRDSDSKRGMLNKQIDAINSKLANDLLALQKSNGILL